MIGNKGFAGIDGLKLDDVVLVGSCANYLFKKNSDLDIYGIIFNESNKIFHKSGTPLNRALAAIARSTLSKNAKFYCMNRYCDIRFINDTSFIISGMYSVKNNTWIKEPYRELTSKFDPKEVEQIFIKKCRAIEDFFNAFEKKNGKYSYEDCKKMSEYYVSLFNEDKNDPDKFIIFMMLDAQGIIKKIGNLIAKSYIEALDRKSVV